MRRKPARAGSSHLIRQPTQQITRRQGDWPDKIDQARNVS